MKKETQACVCARGDLGGTKMGTTLEEHLGLCSWNCRHLACVFSHGPKVRARNDRRLRKWPLCVTEKTTPLTLGHRPAACSYVLLRPERGP